MPAAKKATTATKKATASRAPRKVASPDGQRGGVSALQQAIDELDRLRDQSGEDLRRQLDSAIKRIRDVAGELRERGDERAAAVERAVGSVADDAWQQLAMLAIHGLRDQDALTELSGEIRKRKAQLRKPANKTTTRKAV